MMDVGKRCFFYREKTDREQITIFEVITLIYMKNLHVSTRQTSGKKRPGKLLSPGVLR